MFKSFENELNKLCIDGKSDTRLKEIDEQLKLAKANKVKYPNDSKLYDSQIIPLEMERLKIVAAAQKMPD